MLGRVGGDLDEGFIREPPQRALNAGGKEQFDWNDEGERVDMLHRARRDRPERCPLCRR